MIKYLFGFSIQPLMYFILKIKNSIIIGCRCHHNIGIIVIGDNIACQFNCPFTWHYMSFNIPAHLFSRSCNWFGFSPFFLRRLYRRFFYILKTGQLFLLSHESLLHISHFHLFLITSNIYREFMVPKLFRS